MKFNGELQRWLVDLLIRIPEITPWPKPYAWYRNIASVKHPVSRCIPGLKDIVEAVVSTKRGPSGCGVRAWDGSDLVRPNKDSLPELDFCHG